MAKVLRITTRIDTYDENYLTALAALLLRVGRGGEGDIHRAGTRLHSLHERRQFFLDLRLFCGDDRPGAPCGSQFVD